jgi:hypothetical protein
MILVHNVAGAVANGSATAYVRKHRRAIRLDAMRKTSILFGPNSGRAVIRLMNRGSRL